jgi:hypothetical protein
MGKLAKDLQTAKSRNTSRAEILCGVGKVMMKLDAGDRAALKEVLDNPEIQVIAIARTLEMNDIKVGYDLIARHRRRTRGNGCRCPMEL